MPIVTEKQPGRKRSRWLVTLVLVLAPLAVLLALAVPISQPVRFQVANTNWTISTS